MVFDPPDHRWIIFLQDLSVAVVPVDFPWADDACIGPAGVAELGGAELTQHVRSHVGISPVSALPVAPQSSGGGFHDGSILIEDEEPAHTDLRSIHRHINEWLPVQEIAGLRLFEKDLREFGVLDDEETSNHLTALFHAEVTNSASAEQAAQSPDKDNSRTSPPVSQSRSQKPTAPGAA